MSDINADNYETFTKEELFNQIKNLEPKELGNALDGKQKDEEIMQVQRDRLTLATSSTKIGIYDWYIEEDELIWDDAMYEIYGVNKSNDVEAYETWSLGLHPEDKEYAEKHIALALVGEKDYDIEFRILWPNGAIRYIHGIGTVVRDKDGKAIRMTGTNLDITEQMKSQEILAAVADIQNTFIAESSSLTSFEKMLKAVLDVTESNHGVIGELVKEAGESYFKIHSISNGCEEKRMFSKKESKVTEFSYLKELCSTVANSAEPVILNNLCDNKENVKTLEEGAITNCFLGLPFFSNGELVGIVGIANKNEGYTDYHINLLAPFLATCATLMKAYQNNERRQAAEKRVAKLANIVSHSSDAIISTDKNGTIVSWNKGAEKLFGYTSKDIQGSSFENLVPNSLLSKHKELFQKVYEGEAIESYETRQLNVNKQILHVNMSIFPLINSSGEITGVSSILRDISLQKEAQETKAEFTKQLEVKVKERTGELEQAQFELALSLEKEKELGELKSRFVATASHQFRTPLTVIQSSMGILSMQKEGMDEKFRPSFDKVHNRIKGQIKRMTELMNDVLLLGKINAGSIVPVFLSTNLVSVCQDVVSNYNDIQKDGRAIVIDVKGKPRNLDLDEKLVVHAISNLVSNAFKYSVGKRAPEFKISFEKKEASILVIDEGIGISSKDVPHIFEPFYRASNVAEISGTGLGTSISKEYIELNNGSIGVKSSADQGTEFLITF